MKKILITGGSGFVGRNIKEFFEARGYHIDAPSSGELDCIDEMSVSQYLMRNFYDIVLHFAVYGDGIDQNKNPMKSVEYNLRMFHNFAKCSDFYEKMIYTGSGAEYDKRRPIMMVDENECGNSIPTDSYGLTKYTIGKIVESSTNIFNLRLFGIFGKYEFWKKKFISNLCCKAIKGLPLSISQNCKFDFLWIDDFCRMLEQFINLESPQYHTYNAVRGESIELVKLAAVVADISDVAPDIIVCRPGMQNEYTASNKRIMEEIPDFVYTDIQDSTKELYNYYKKIEDEIDIYSLIYG